MESLLCQILLILEKSSFFYLDLILQWTLLCYSGAWRRREFSLFFCWCDVESISIIIAIIFDIDIFLLCSTCYRYITNTMSPIANTSTAILKVIYKSIWPKNGTLVTLNSNFIIVLNATIGTHSMLDVTITMQSDPIPLILKIINFNEPPIWQL